LRPSGRIRVALIFGGRSGEHEISLRSADSIKQALDSARYSLAEYFIDKNGKWHPGPISPEPGANSGIDVAFPMLHGTFGEDGTVQGLLELAGLPFFCRGDGQSRNEKALSAGGPAGCAARCRIAYFSRSRTTVWLSDVRETRQSGLIGRNPKSKE
jgi:hypothetical protein